MDKDLAAVADVKIGLVGENEQIILEGQPGEFLHFLLRGGGSRRILVVVVDQNPGAVADPFADGFHIQDEMVLRLFIPVRHSHSAVKFDLRFIDGISRIRVKDLVSRIHSRQDELADGGLSAGLDGNVFSRQGNLVAPAHILGQGLPQFGNAGGGAVAGFPFSHGLNGGIHDNGRRDEVHVAEVKRIDLLPLAGQIGGLEGNGESRFGSDAAHPLGNRNVHGSTSLIRGG